MGDIRKILSEEQINTDVVLFNDSVRFESGEEGCVHFHWRDLRILLDKEQMETFKNLVKEINDIIYTGKDVLLGQEFIPSEVFFNEDLKIELMTNGCVHFHYRDIRIEMREEIFLVLCRLWKNAYQEWENKDETIVGSD